MIDLALVRAGLAARGISGHWGTFLGDALTEKQIVAMIVEIEQLWTLVRDIATVPIEPRNGEEQDALDRVLDMAGDMEQSNA